MFIRLFVAVFLLATIRSHADDTLESRAQVTQSWGYRYLISFAPLTGDSTLDDSLSAPFSDALRLHVMAVWMSGFVFVRTIARTHDGPVVDEVGGIMVQGTTEVSLPVELMRSAPAIVTGYTVEVLSNVPICVATRYRFRYRTEVVHHLPVGAWGTDYRVVSLPQDRLRIGDRTRTFTPYTVITAAEDGTSVSVTPTAPMDGGASLGIMIPGRTYRIALNKGETIRLHGRRDDDLIRSGLSDITGTHVASDKPVSVLSGHDMIAVGTSGDDIVVHGTVVSDGVPLRNMVVEEMLPRQYAGTEFVTGMGLFDPASGGVDRDKVVLGDPDSYATRFVAMTDGTILSTYDTGQRNVIPVDTLDAGQYYTAWTDTAMVRYWHASNPALAVQFMTSKAMIGAGPDSDLVYGRPYMSVVPATQRMGRSGRFSTWSDRHGQTVALLTRIDDTVHVKFDGWKVSWVPGFSVIPVPGTRYCIIGGNVAGGYHRVDCDSGATALLWYNGHGVSASSAETYGSYGGMSFTTSDDDDSIAVSGEMECGYGRFTMTALGKDTGQARFFEVVAGILSNMTIVMGENNAAHDSISYELRISDMREDALAVVIASTTSGHILRRRYQYRGPILGGSPATIDFGRIKKGSPPVCHTVRVGRAAADSDSTPVTLKVRSTLPYIEIVPAIFHLSAGDSIDVRICMMTDDISGPITDTLWAVTGCDVEIPVCELRAEKGASGFTATDVDFGWLPLNREARMDAYLSNSGAGTVVITGYDRTMLDESGEFILEDLDRVLPLTIPGGSRYIIFVRFHPTGRPGPRFVGVPLFTNGAGPDTIVVLRGDAYDPSVDVHDDEEVRMSIGALAPSPVSASGIVSIPITTTIPGEMTMTLENIEGRIVGTELSDHLGKGDHMLKLNLAAFGATPGLYMVRLRSTTGLVKTLPLILTE